LAAFEREEIGITDAYNASLLDEDQQAAAYEQFKETGEFNAKPAPTAEKPKKERDDSQKRAYALLTDIDGTKHKAAGSVAIIAAIDGEDFGGHISEGDATGLEYVMIATALVGEFLERIGDDTDSRDALKTSLAALFEDI